MKRFKLLVAWNSPQKLQAINGWLTVLWFIAAIPICIWLSESIKFLVFISVYAVVTGHLSSWSAARVEVNQANDANVQDVVDILQGKPLDLDVEITKGE